MKKLIILTFIFLSYSLTCSSQKTINSSTPSQQISFGKGGGFVGSVSTYTLTKRGQIFETTPMKGELWEMKRINKISRRLSKKIFRDAVDLMDSEIEFNHPGNIYYFIEINNGEVIKRFTWGDVNYEVPEEIQDLYNELKNIHKP